jgi:hypothetical protein
MAERGVDRRELSLSLVPTENSESGEKPEFWHRRPWCRRHAQLARSVVSVLACRFRSRVDLELEVLALRHQLNVLRRQRVATKNLVRSDGAVEVCYWNRARTRFPRAEKGK